MKFSQVYVHLCKLAGKSEYLKNIQDPPADLQRNLDFIDMEIRGEEVVALALLGALGGAGLAGLILLLAWIFGFSLIISLTSLSLPILLYFLIGWYPSWKAKGERVKGLGSAPQMISYMTVALKMNPNLERAAEFTAKHMRESLGRKFRDELWNVYISATRNAEEALSKFGREWGKQSSELKRSIDLIKSSVEENSEKSRKEVLDQALKTSFEGVRARMESFADNLQIPTIVIYGIGVLLPLVLLAVLPVISSIGMQISGFELALIYCFILPLTIYLLEKQILASRPNAFPPPNIPSKDSRKKAISISIPIIIMPLLLTIFLDLPSSIIALAFLWSLSGGISAFCYLSSVKTHQVRKKNRDLEEEFCESLVQLGNQLESNRPPEDAFQKTAEFTKGSEASKIMERTSTNLNAGGMDIQSAFFDPEVGSLREVHSPPVRNTFRMLIDILNRSAQAAGKAILHTADHLEKLKEVETQIRRRLKEIVSSMRSVALFFAPFIASITVQLQQILSENERDASLRKWSSNPLINLPECSGVLRDHPDCASFSLHSRNRVGE